MSGHSIVFIFRSNWSLIILMDFHHDAHKHKKLASEKWIHIETKQKKGQFTVSGNYP